MYDIVIVGSGPAGASLARLLGNKYKLLIVDRRDLEDEHPENKLNKCCGGLLSPDAQKMIAKLGLILPKDVLVDPQLYAVKTLDLTNNLEGLYQRYYQNMDREKFDRWLVSLIPDSVDKCFNTLVKNIEKTPQGYEISTRYKGLEAKVKTRIIVGADGAFSRVRNYLKHKEKPDTYISIQEWFKCENVVPYYTAIFDEEISDFYSWIIPKNDYIMLGSALRPDDHARVRFERLKTKLVKKGYSFERKIKTEGAFIYRPIRLSHFLSGKDNIALIGEASGAISPSSAEGISYAMKTASFLADSLQEGVDGFLSRYDKLAINTIYPNLLMKNLKSPAMYNPYLRKLAISSRLFSIK